MADAQTIGLSLGAAMGAQLVIGVSVCSRTAAEVSYTRLVRADVLDLGDINYHAFGISAIHHVGKVRGATGLTGFGRLGLAFLENNGRGYFEMQQDNSVHPILGLGLVYREARGIGLRAQYTHYQRDIQFMSFDLIGKSLLNHYNSSL